MCAVSAYETVRLTKRMFQLHLILFVSNLFRPHSTYSLCREDARTILMPRTSHAECRPPQTPGGCLYDKLPSVTTAPGKLPSQQDNGVPLSALPFSDDSALRAQISRLSLIKAYGYGPIPGTPFRAKPLSPDADRLAGHNVGIDKRRRGQSQAKSEPIDGKPRNGPPELCTGLRWQSLDGGRVR